MYDLTNLLIADSGFGINVLQVTAELVAGALNELLASSADGADISQKLDYSILTIYQDKLEAAIRDMSLPPLPVLSPANALC
ncbi:hypothetical protein GV819_17070 [Pseudomonas sp. Fl5BN2]|uniref:hypothetical protein n=1 Tax=unclassified Pseudomonas TaxID=196821 RepID=UPI001376E9F3|nr:MULTISPECIES: hypothetical protein [unclassified Pseudomonas]NBF04000.1 hypothetical protein [Pseudomonas sp. Fl5BN2]NBF09754.1 hypothetical protein [Pseudomonas sp. Fl4BN1]